MKTAIVPTLEKFATEKGILLVRTVFPHFVRLPEHPEAIFVPNGASQRDQLAILRILTNTTQANEVNQ